MKVTLIGHASILIEAGGLSILSDPWWGGPCFGAQWWNYPEPRSDLIDGRRLDYIYISHGHHDHFHPGTLRSLGKDCTVLVSKAIGLADPVRRLGFSVIEVEENHELRLGSGTVACRVMETYAQDTLMSLTDGHEVCLNLNDALHSAPAAVQAAQIARLKGLYPKIDYVFCGYGVASHFPNCYVIPGKNREATTARRQLHFNRQWAKLIHELQPRYGFPFAADVVFFEDDLFWANEPTHNSQRPTDTFRRLYPGSSVQIVDIAPGFVIEDGKVIAEVVRQPVRASELRMNFAEQIRRANRVGAVDESEIEQIATLLKSNLDSCAKYLKSYERDYRFLLRFRNSAFGIQIEKRGTQLTLTRVPLPPPPGATYELVYTTRLSYVRWALTRPHGEEVLFVGSGGVFEYANAARASENLHRELTQILRMQPMPPRPRVSSRSRKLLTAVKQAIRRLLGRRSEDLYDLAQWTLFDKARG